jgi:hypothetical protein
VRPDAAQVDQRRRLDPVTRTEAPDPTAAAVWRWAAIIPTVLLGMPGTALRRTAAGRFR